MSTQPQLPVTALASITRTPGLELVLAGQGSSLYVHSTVTAAPQLIYVHRVFGDQSIHGIFTLQLDNKHTPPQRAFTTRCLVWGGRSVAILEIHVRDLSVPLEIHCQDVLREQTVKAWILDACVTSPELGRRGQESVSTLALLVTAHNEVLSITSSPLSLEPFVSFHIEAVATGPRSVLYSAHLNVLNCFDVLIAGGTIFGEVQLWHIDGRDLVIGQPTPVPSKLLRRFTGHVGSVFGVRLLNSWQEHSHKVLLASCSDDRTIRVWNTGSLLENDQKVDAPARRQPEALTGFQVSGETEIAQPSDCLCSAMGHASRIWSLKFWQDARGTFILSFGEDASVHIWKLLQNSKMHREPQHLARVQLKRQRALSFHQGKNIWAAELFFGVDGSSKVLTGGADGYILASPLIPPLGVMTWTGTLAECFAYPRPAESRISMKSIFESMTGTWRMERAIISKLNTYPSGTFQGEATLQPRPPSDSEFDLEMLYHEHGQFQANQGMRSPASRKYVYRYQIKDDQLTAWFVKPYEGTAVDYLFHQVNAEWSSSRECSASQVTAQGHHLCVKDDYNARYTFKLQEGRLTTWTLSYNVKGPHKDYISTAKYIRTSSAAEPPSAYGSPAETTDVEKVEENANFKVYCWLSADAILATTSDGRVLLGTLHVDLSPPSADGRHNLNVSWRCVGQFDDLRSYSLCTRVGPDIALLASASGQVYMYNHKKTAVEPIVKMERKVAAILAQSSSSSIKDVLIVVACQGQPQAHCFTISCTEFDLSSGTLPLDLPAQFPVTSGDTHGASCILLGSRSGALCLYEIDFSNSMESMGPAFNLRHAHGTDSVTGVLAYPASVPDQGPCCFFTTGRDGTFAIHRVTRGRHLETVHRSGPLSRMNLQGLSFNAHLDDVVLWGFQDKYFMAWSQKQHRELLRVDCGGCHRDWSYCNGHGQEPIGQLVWTQAGRCHIYSQPHASHDVVQQGGHGRDIKSIAVRPLNAADGLPVLIATGAEDTHIQVSRIVPREDINFAKIEPLAVISENVTGVHALRWTPGGEFLLSAGGKEELTIWHVQPVPGLQGGVIRVASAPVVTALAELRVTDFDILELEQRPGSQAVSMMIASAYSNSTFRLWLFSHTSGKTEINLLAAATYGNWCITHCHFFALACVTYLVTASTDGSLAFWAIPDVDLSSAQSSTLPLIYRHPVHQSGIKAAIIISVTETEVLIVTGGDDNTLATTRVCESDDASQPHRFACSTLLVPKAHAAAVNAIVDISTRPRTREHAAGDQRKAMESGNLTKRNELRIATTGNDQTVKTWTVELDRTARGAQGIRVRKNGKWCSQVADTVCMDTIVEPDGGMALVVAGIGLEIWQVRVTDLVA